MAPLGWGMHPSIQHFLHSLGPWALFLFFAYLFIESTIFVGLFIPADIVVLFAGGLAGEGVYSLGGALVAVIGGTTLGDMIGYLVGWRWGHQLVAKWPWLRRHYEDHRREMEVRLRKWTLVTILFTRLSSFGHAFVPFLCGMARLRLSHYAYATAVSETVWAGGLALAGYVLGRNWPILQKWMASLGSGLLSLLLLVVIFTIVRRWFYRRRRQL
jgi:membrane-associated protein